MARGRMLNQKISDDITFNEMSIEHQFFFMRTLPFLDRDGLITGHSLLLPSKVLPLMPDHHQKFKEAVKEWIEAGFVVEYTDGKQPILFFVNFADNQVNMRYERESPSDFPPPPGYKRTPKGMIKDDAEQSQDADTSTEKVTENSDPDKVRHESGKDPRLSIREDQVKDQGEDHAGACEASAEPENQFPPLDSVTEDYLPGLPDPRTRKNKRTEVAERFTEAEKLGLSAEQFRLLVDSLLLGFGKKTLVDAGNDKALHHAQEVTLSLMRMGEQYRTPEGIQAIFRNWYTDDWRGKKGDKPTSEQLTEHASAMIDGVAVTKITPTQVTGVAGELKFDPRKIMVGVL